MDAIRFEHEADDSFYRMVKQRVDAYFRTTGKSRLADGSVLLKAAVFGGLIAGSYVLVLTHPLPLWTLLPLAFVFGTASLLMAINIGHDAAHHVLVRSAFWNDVVQGVSFSILGVSAFLWRMRHTKSHHIFPNVNGCDIDIDENPFLRLSPNQPWRWHFQFQHLYAPFAYVSVALHTILWQDFMYLCKRRLANMTDITYPPHQYAIFALCKVFYFGAVLAVPMIVLPLSWWQVLLGYLAMNAVASLVFVFLLIGTHFSDVTDFPAIAADGTIGQTWAQHNLATACDWAPHSRVAHFFVGGVNAHASHHLIPGGEPRPLPGHRADHRGDCNRIRRAVQQAVVGGDCLLPLPVPPKHGAQADLRGGRRLRPERQAEPHPWLVDQNHTEVHVARMSALF